MRVGKMLQGLDGVLDALGGHLGLLGIAECSQAEIALAALAKANTRSTHLSLIHI